MAEQATPLKKRAKGAPEDVFWADSLASRILRASAKPVVKAGASPSGAKHIGNMFDVMKGYMVYKALVKKGADARFVLTHDDRDPLRKIPPRIPDSDGKWAETAGDINKKMQPYIGHPYSSVPDPFGCHYTWAEHFSSVWENGILASGISDREIKFVSNNDLYMQGKFEPYFKMIFSRLEQVRKTIAMFQESVAVDYIPVLAICENCGKIIGKVTDFDSHERIVSYACETRELAGQYTAEGCGNKGVQKWRQCKLVWRFEWPAQWGILNVSFEAFGKDHAEGSWPSGKAIAENIFGIPPPLHHVYEFILVNGKKMSARHGNAYIAQEILDIIEPEIFMYFYTKRSGKQRNLDLKNIYRLADEFENAERLYFGQEGRTQDSSVDARQPGSLNRHAPASGQRAATLRREYESSMSAIPRKKPLRVDYQFAATIAQIAPDFRSALRMLRDAGHVRGQLSSEDKNRIAMRLSLAKNWVERFAKEYRVQIGLDKDALQKFSKAQISALLELEKLLKGRITSDELHTAFYDIAKRNGLSSQDFFRAAYIVLINKTSGPRLAPFILALGKDRVMEILDGVKRYSGAF